MGLSENRINRVLQVSLVSIMFRIKLTIAGPNIFRNTHIDVQN